MAHLISKKSFMICVCVCDNMRLFPDMIVPKTDGKAVKHSTNECYPNLLEML